jgi:dipeptidyl aminopeptidase/acylaminoacyl peptidase
MILILFCSSCSSPSEAPATSVRAVEPSPTNRSITETLAPTEEPQNTAIPIPTSEPQRKIGLENVNRLEPHITIQQEEGWIKSLTFSADGTLLAGAASHNDLKVWRVEDGALEVTLTGHNARIGCAAFSPDGKYLATGSQDSSIIIWNVSDWSIFRKLEAHESFVNSVAFSPDSKLLVSGGEDRRVILWQVESGQVLHRLEEPIQRLVNAFFSSDGGLIAASSAENRARVWLVESGELLWTLLGPSGIHALALTPHGSILATASSACWPTDGGCDPISPIIFWDMSDGSQIRTSEEKTLVISMVFSPDGDLLFAGVEKDNSIEVYRVADGSVLWELIGHKERITAVAINAEGTRFASGDRSGQIIVWWLPEG